ncbi:MAG: hypothetical protein J2P30_02225 [Actinobacteria bacterium]|nr:hypothetical protein [Actinomycetota bacterium]
MASCAARTAPRYPRGRHARTNHQRQAGIHVQRQAGIPDYRADAQRLAAAWQEAVDRAYAAGRQPPAQSEVIGAVNDATRRARDAYEKAKPAQRPLIGPQAP